MGQIIPPINQSEIKPCLQIKDFFFKNLSEASNTIRDRMRLDVS